MNLLKEPTLALIMALTTTLNVHSAAANPAFDRAVSAYHEVVGKDDMDATENAAKLFSAVLAQHPKEYRTLVYQGSLTARQAKLTWMPWSKLKLANAGIDMMDKGVNAINDSAADARVVIEAHMVRGLTSARMPKMFKRHAVAESDFKLIREHASFNHLSAANQATVLAFSAVLAHRAEAPDGAAKFLAAASSIDDRTAARIWAER